MNLPKPNKNETLEDYTKRMMPNDMMKKKWPKKEEREAACKSMYKKKDGPGTGQEENKNNMTSSASSSGGSSRKKGDSVARIDYYDEEGSYLNENFRVNEDGFLKGRAVVTNVGVFKYVLPDGSIQRELRLPEEVFAMDSLDSLKMIPVTNGHPREKVNSENVKKYQVGFVGDSVHTDPYHVSVPVTISDPDTIAESKGGRNSFSCGYNVDLEYKSGTWMGVDYDAIQRNIRYNHLAVVDRGRAGDAVTMKFDSVQNIAVMFQEEKQDTSGTKQQAKNIKEGSNMSQILKIDGVEYEVDKDVIKHLNALEKSNKDLQSKFDETQTEFNKTKSTLEAERDDFKQKTEDLKKKLDETEAVTPEMISKAVNDRMVVLGAAKVAGVEVKEDQNDLDIKKEIIKTLSPNSAEKIDTADEVYINARFDGALETLEEMKTGSDSDNNLRGDSAGSGKGSESELKSDSARQRMIEAQTKAWMSDEEV